MNEDDREQRGKTREPGLYPRDLSSTGGSVSSISPVCVVSRHRETRSQSRGESRGVSGEGKQWKVGAKL